MNLHRHRGRVALAVSSPLFLLFAGFAVVVIVDVIGPALAFAPPPASTSPSSSRTGEGHRRHPPIPRARAASASAGGGRRPATTTMSSSGGGGVQLRTLSRILLPSLASSVAAYALFPPLSLGLSYLINDPATFAVLSVDSSQFVQNFLTVTGLTFSILVGQTYYFMYQQQEAVFVSLFREVTEAKSLLEQVSLVCRGRGDMYRMCLGAVKRCVRVCLFGCPDDGCRSTGGGAEGGGVRPNGHFFRLLCSFRFVRNSMDGPTGTRLVGGRRRREGSSDTRSRRWHSLTQ
jgi:hypothetical protein